jgi:hypothetical protein
VTGGEAVGGTDRSTTWAARVFAAVVAAAFPLYLVLGRDQWFFQDDWEFLANRDGGSFTSLMEPHNEHWSTLPVIAYRLLWTVFGLRTYVPYQALAIATHLTVAVLLRVVMRRAGVHPWLATASASAFVLFGSGFQDIVWGFQIGFVGPVVFGLLQLLLTDHDGPVDRRDALGLVCGALALLCSGTAVTMVVVVGLAVVIRRGPRPALLQTAPLAALYLLWWGAYGREGAPDRDRGTLRQVLRFVHRGLRGAVEDLTTYRWIFWPFVAAVLVGAVLVVVHRGRDWRARLAVPIAMAGGALVFFTITGIGRVVLIGARDADKSRYVHVGLALMLPAMTVAVDAVVRRWRALLVPACALFLVGVPANLDRVRTLQEQPLEGRKRDVLLLASSDVQAQLSRGFRPFDGAERNISIGWLRDGRASGRIPEPDAPVDEQDEADVVAMITIREPVERPDARCRPVRGTVERTVTRGDRIRFRGPVVVRVRPPGGPSSTPRELRSGPIAVVVVGYGPADVTIRPSATGVVCR